MNVIVYDPVPVRLQETVSTLEAHGNITAVQSVSQLLNIPMYDVVILYEDIDPEWVGSLVRHCPHIKVLIGMERKDIAEVRKWINQIGVHECMNYPMTREKLARVLGLTNPATGAEATPQVTATKEMPPVVAMHVPVEEPVEEPVMAQTLEPEHVASSVEQAVQAQEVAIEPEHNELEYQIADNQKPEHDEPEYKQPEQFESESQTQIKRKKISYAAPNADGADLQAPAQEDVQQGVFSPTDQEIVAITSARGGVGKSTIAYNLAVLAAEAGIRTVIIDNDPRGNMVSISNTKYRYTADHWDKIDPERESENTVQNLLAPMACGAFLLPSGTELNGMTSDILEKVIHLLRRSFQLIIIDCEPRFTPATLVAYENASTILVVTPADVNSFSRTIEKVKQIRECGIEAKKAHLVINKIEKSFSKEEESILVERAKCKVIAKVPTTSDIRKMQKQGKAAVAIRRSSFTKQIKTLLSRVIVVSPSKATNKPKKKSGGLLSIFKKTS